MAIMLPHTKSSNSKDGPVSIAYHWTDEERIIKYRSIYERLGYLPSSRFNTVLSLALAHCNLRREDIYMTQTFHLVPRSRSEKISISAIDQSFDEVTRHEVAGRKILALGDEAFAACQRHRVANAIHVCHPSKRGLTDLAKARLIADGLGELGF